VSPHPGDRFVSGVLHVNAVEGQPAHLHIELSDGSSVRLRRVAPEDRDALVEGFNRLSKQARYTRFFSSMPTLSGQVLDRLADLVGHCHVAIAAFSDGDGDGSLTPSESGVGVARAIQDAANVPAELAVTVIDDHSGLGIGELLLRVLIVVMSEKGVDSFSATVLRENVAMLKTFAKLGAETHTDHEDPSIVLVRLCATDLSPSERWSPDLEAEVLSFARNLA
jgi:GNAT superfamily N-acetyltransferase